MDNTTNWCIPCDGEDIEPSAEELDSMYQSLENGSSSMLELQWRFPGRRLPSPTAVDEVEATESSDKEM